MFPFSPRKGTPAATMPDQIEKAVKRERGAIVRELETELQQAYFQTLVGERLQLLVESVEPDGSVKGTSCRYGQVVASGLEANDNDLIDVRISGVGQGVLIGGPDQGSATS